MDNEIKLSIIMPVYNEAGHIAGICTKLKPQLDILDIKYEIIVVDDGSVDETAVKLRELDFIKTITHPYNKGYGAALKSGVRNSKYPWVMFFDGDGQHDAGQIKEFIQYACEYDLIAGDRSGGMYVRPTLRKPGLWLLRNIANYLVDFKIPDLNCGFRLIKKDILLHYIHLMPNGYSMSTTTTLAFLKDKKSVKFMRVNVAKREKNSKSHVRPRDAVTTLMLIFRIIMIFSPLRIFFPVSLVMFIFGGIFLINDLIQFNVTDSTIFILLTSALTFFFGLIADQVASLRRELRINK